MKTKSLLLFSLSISLLATSCSKKKENYGNEIMPVDVASVVIDTVLLSKEYPGTLSAQSVVSVMGRVDGNLLTQNFEDGDHVKKGQLLFTFEATKYRDAYEQAKAALATAESEFAYNSKNYEAMQKALASDAVSQIEVLQAKSAVEQSQAAIANAKAALETAQTNLSYCTVYAPITGTTNIGNYSPGSYIPGGAAPVELAKIYDNSVLRANFYIEDASFLRMFENENNRSKIDFDSVPILFSESLPHKYYGKLIYISPDVDTSTGTLHLRAELDNKWDELKSGMYATVNLPYKLDTNAILVKDASISTSQTNKFLYVVNDSNKVVYTPIEIGEMANDSMRIVTSGLKGNEKYVTKALLKVRPGMEVKPVLTK